MADTFHDRRERIFMNKQVIISIGREYGSGGHVNHVAIYIGGGMIIHASNPSSGIKISNAYYRQPIKVGRVIKD